MPRALNFIFNRSIWLYILIIAVFAVSVNFKKAARARAHYLLGVFYNQDLSNYNDGIVYFDYLAHQRPKDGRNYFFLGYCYLYLARYDNALVYFEKAAQLLPEDDMTRQYLAHTKSKINNDNPEIPLPLGQIAIPLE